MAVTAAITAFRNPNGVPGTLNVTGKQAWFNFLWACYQNSQFENLAAWAQYREQYQLYRNIRSIYNPTRRLVNFYVSQVYPGVLSDDASKLPDGVQIAIPLSEDTDDDIKSAIAQFWQWSNWQSGNKLMVRYGGATGSCLVEIFDNVERGKVSANIVWPGLIAAKALDGGSSLILDDVGNVKFYALEHQALDADGTPYTYRKEVSQETFRYFKDDVPFSPDGVRDPEEENPYGFVPAVWCKHIDEGDDYGAPAISGGIAKIDELNGLVSHTHDQVDILIDSPGIIGASGPIGRIQSDAAAIKNANAEEFAAVNAAKEKPTKRLILKGPADTSWTPMTGNLDPASIVPHVDRLLMEIEKDFPELGMYHELRKMSQVTGPGAARMMGDVYSRVLEVSSNYDQQSIKLFQMALAIGGMRFHEGKLGWKDKTEQRKKFAPFDLSSYEQGDLDFSINPRPLIVQTEADTIDLTGKRLDNAKKAQGIFNEDRILELAGVSDPEERAKILDDREANAISAPAAARALPTPPMVRGLLAAQPNGKALQ